MARRTISLKARKGGLDPQKRDGGRRVSRSEDLLHRLEEEIFLGKLQPGARLDEKLLADRFKVSRTPVREALWHLASSGLVEMRRHHGAIVKKLTLVELIEMFQVMAELEGLCARLSARRMTLAERKQLRQIQKAGAKMVATQNFEGFFENNNEFHEAIFVGSKNAFLQQEARRLRSRVNPHRRYITYQPGRMQKSLEEHETIIEAIERNDDSEAQRLMRDHVNMLGEVVADFIASLSGGAHQDEEYKIK
ncbi:MAG TPA: GntR family transcriptional regulator [Pseudolabrys sp.]|nr:GntR family transcriptional regulator [Pseudolabrys sp.]